MNIYTYVCIHIYIYEHIYIRIILPCVYTSHNTSLWRRQWHPTLVLLPEKPHGQRNLSMQLQELPMAKAEIF